MREKRIKELNVRGVVRGEYFALDRKRRKKVIKEVKERELRKKGVEFLEKEDEEKEKVKRKKM